MKRFTAAVVTALFAIAPLGAAAATASPALKLASKLEWRSIGPYIGGRVVAVDGVPSEPSRFYMGGVQGGVWRSTNYGLSWENISDGQIPGTASSIGAIAVAPSNPKIVYAARLTLATQISSTLNTLNTAINNAVTARSHLSSTKRAKLDAVINHTVQFQVLSSEGDLLHETRLRDHLAFLMNSLDLAYQPPTAAEYATFTELKREADAAVAALNALSR